MLQLLIEKSARYPNAVIATAARNANFLVISWICFALTFTLAGNVDFFDIFLLFLCPTLGVLILRPVIKYRSTEIQQELENQEEEEEDHDQEDHTEYEYEDEADDDGEEYEKGGALTTVEIMEPTGSSSIFHGSVINSGAGSGEIDGLFCSICFESWTGSGGHQLCCLPCGHVYGLSCVKRWLQSSKKCPECNVWCTWMDVRRLYATRLCVADEELHKSVQSLEEAESANLEQTAPVTVEELIDQIRRNPTLVEKIETALAQLHEHQVFTP